MDMPNQSYSVKRRIIFLSTRERILLSHICVVTGTKDEKIEGYNISCLACKGEGKVCVFTTNTLFNKIFDLFIIFIERLKKLFSSHFLGGLDLVARKES